MSYGIKLYVSGELACFTRPEMKSERVSYDFMTPSAARGLLEAIYWKPEMAWEVRRIHVLKPIRFTNVRRNEVGARMTGPTVVQLRGGESERLGFYAEEERQQRAATLLRDVAYVVEASVRIRARTFEKGGEEMPETACVAKHLEIFKRRAQKGQFFQHPYLGCREFPAWVRLLGDEADIPASTLSDADKNRDFGFMLHDIAFIPAQKRDKDAFLESNRGTYVRAEPRFFRARLNDGVLDVPPFETSIA